MPGEVADLLREYKLAEAAYFLRTYRHKAYFSLDYDVNVERDVLMAALSPLDILEQKEENIRLYRALASLPEKQKNRIYAHYFLGMSKADIAKAEGTHKSRISRSINAGLHSLEKILKKILIDGNFNLKNEMNNRGTYYQAGQAIRVRWERKEPGALKQYFKFSAVPSTAP